MVELRVTLSCALCFAEATVIVDGEACPDHPQSVRVSDSDTVRAWCGSHRAPELVVHGVVISA